MDWVQLALGLAGLTAGGIMCEKAAFRSPSDIDPALFSVGFAFAFFGGLAIVLAFPG